MLFALQVCKTILFTLVHLVFRVSQHFKISKEQFQKDPMGKIRVFNNNNNNIIIISTIFIQDSLFSKDITAITKGPVKIKVCKVKEKRSK